MTKTMMNNSQKYLLSIENASVSVEQKAILDAISLNIAPGTVHVITGPNGSGKSSLAYTIMGHPKYICISGSISYSGVDLISLPAWQRAVQGIFMTMQQPIGIPGLSVYGLLKEAIRARDVHNFSLDAFSYKIETAADRIGIDRSWLHRSLDSGFSGGEKKKLELLQMLVLRPTLVIFDELDSGLDAQALIKVASVMNDYKVENSQASFLVISHQKNFLELLRPSYSHKMCKGKIVSSELYGER